MTHILFISAILKNGRKNKKQIELYTAGATMHHKNPFEELKYYKSELKNNLI
ncbi:hypothetical protein [Aquimarina macrocephali]|uniref:hypothetical protein n=1 Tax=Aquimarina macrocephali TaxID=666563 RepID=UPI003F66CE4A